MDQKRYGARYKARQRAVNLLFEAEFRDTDPVEVLDLHIRLTDNDDAQEIYRPIRDYTATLVRGVAEELDEVDAAISAHLDTNWTIDRLPAIDRAIMRIAAWELLFNPEVPKHAAIKDGIELSNNYSTTVAPGYINVTLDGIAKNPQAHKLAEATEATDATDDLAADTAVDSEVYTPAEVADPSTDTNVEAAALAADNAELADGGDVADSSEFPVDNAEPAASSEVTAESDSDADATDAKATTDASSVDANAAEEVPAKETAPEAKESAEATSEAETTDDTESNS